MNAGGDAMRGGRLAETIEQKASKATKSCRAMRNLAKKADYGDYESKAAIAAAKYIASTWPNTQASTEATEMMSVIVKLAAK
jgi:hypothetical protein